MADTILNVAEAAGILAEAAAGMFVDNNHFIKTIDKVPKKEFDGKNGYKSGDTIYIPKSTRFVEHTQFDITGAVQEIKEEKVALTLDTISGVSFDLDSSQMATKASVEDAIKRFIEPGINTIKNGVERRFLEKATDATFNSVGTAGSNVFAPDDILAAREKMNKFLAPQDENRYFLHDSTAGRLAVGARKGLFQSSADIAKQYKQGFVGTADGFSWLENELLNSHTNGNDVVFEVRTTVSAEGQATLVVEALTTTTGTVKKGTVFTVADVYAVHPVTYQTYPFLQQFTVTADKTADASGYATLDVSPAMYTAASGALQNISAFPVDGAAITPVGAASTAYTQSLAYHKSAFRMASVPLVIPKNAEYAAQRTVDGITIAIVRDWDQLTRKMITRMDFLGGLVADRPEWACRVTA